MMDDFQNEIEYQKQLRPDSSSTRALEWAGKEIGLLRAENEALKLEIRMYEKRFSGPGIGV